jgi:hypothetical protein
VAARQPTGSSGELEVGAITDKLGTFIRHLEHNEKQPSQPSQPQLQPQSQPSQPQPQPQSQPHMPIQMIQRQPQSVQPLQQQQQAPQPQLQKQMPQLQSLNMRLTQSMPQPQFQPSLQQPSSQLASQSQRMRSHSQPQPNLSPQQQHRQLILQSFQAARSLQQPQTSLHHSHPLLLVRSEDPSVRRVISADGASERSPGPETVSCAPLRPLNAQDRNALSADNLREAALARDRMHTSGNKSFSGGQAHQGPRTTNEAKQLQQKQEEEEEKEEDAAKGLNRTYKVLYDFTGSSPSELTIKVRVGRCPLVV